MNNDKTEYVLDNNSETKVINKNNSLMIEKINTFTKEIQKFNSLKDEMLEMLEWYKTQKKNENVIDGVITAKRGFYTLRHILPKHRYIQRTF
ncbi:MAG: hypothetical protein K0R54_5676 [Clostridiaceae bacterium]|jgi:hypothetical protein|nr:hypothetical protein [Clostridiaceae bacterium]